MKDSHLACPMSDFDENDISTDTREPKIVRAIGLGCPRKVYYVHVVSSDEMVGIRKRGKPMRERGIATDFCSGLPVPRHLKLRELVHANSGELSLDRKRGA